MLDLSPILSSVSGYLNFFNNTTTFFVNHIIGLNYFSRASKGNLQCNMCCFLSIYRNYFHTSKTLFRHELLFSDLWKLKFFLWVQHFSTSYTNKQKMLSFVKVRKLSIEFWTGFTLKERLLCILSKLYSYYTSVHP